VVEHLSIAGKSPWIGSPALPKKFIMLLFNVIFFPIIAIIHVNHGKFRKLKVTQVISENST
jgi:hypothetical protein